MVTALVAEPTTETKKEPDILKFLRITREECYTPELDDFRRQGHEEKTFLKFPRWRLNQVFELYLTEKRRRLGLAPDARFSPEHFNDDFRRELWQLRFMVSWEYRDFRAGVIAHRDFDREVREAEEEIAKAKREGRKPDKEKTDRKIWWIYFTPYEQYAIYEEIRHRLITGRPYVPSKCLIPDWIRNLVPEWRFPSVIAKEDFREFETLDTETMDKLMEFALDVVSWVEDIEYLPLVYIGNDENENPVWACYPDPEKTKVWALTDYEWQHVRKLITHYKLRQTNTRRAYDLLGLKASDVKSMSDDYFWTHLGEIQAGHLWFPLIPENLLPVGWTIENVRVWWLGPLAALPPTFQIHMGNWVGFEHAKRKLEYVDSFNELTALLRELREGAVTYKDVQERYFPKLKQEQDFIFAERGVIRELNPVDIYETATGGVDARPLAAVRYNDFATWLDWPETVENDDFISPYIRRFFNEATRFLSRHERYLIPIAKFLRHREVAEDLFLLQDIEAITNSDAFRALENSVRSRIKGWKDIADLRADYVIPRDDTIRINGHRSVMMDRPLLPVGPNDTTSVLVPIGPYPDGQPLDAYHFIRRDLNNWFNQMFNLADAKWESTWANAHRAKEQDKKDVIKAFSDGYFIAQNYFPMWPNAERRQRMEEVGLIEGGVLIPDLALDLNQPSSRSIERRILQIRLYEEVDEVTLGDLHKAFQKGQLTRSMVIKAFEDGLYYHYIEQDLEFYQRKLRFWLNRADHVVRTNFQVWKETYALIDSNFASAILNSWGYGEPDRVTKATEFRVRSRGTANEAVKMGAIIEGRVQVKDSQTKRAKTKRGYVEQWEDEVNDMAWGFDAQRPIGDVRRIIDDAVRERQFRRANNDPQELPPPVDNMAYIEESLPLIREVIRVYQERIREGRFLEYYQEKIAHAREVEQFLLDLFEEIEEEEFESYGFNAPSFTRLDRERQETLLERFDELREW